MSSGKVEHTWQTLLARAAAEAGAGRIDDAIATYRSIIELSPGLAEAHHNCGALLFARGDFDGAAQSFAEAATRKPDWPAPLLALGHVFFHHGRFAGAQAAFERALALDANSIEALKIQAYLALIKTVRGADGNGEGVNSSFGNKA